MKSQEPAGRPKRSFWFDPRFAIGLGLVIASVAGVYAIVANADRSTTVYAARAPLTAGETVTAADLATTNVRLNNADQLYLQGDELPAHGVVVTRTIAAGELIPASAVGKKSDVGATSVVVNVQGQLAASIESGSVVDVWSAEKEEHGTFSPPTVLADAATIVRVLESDSVMAGRDAVAVEVLVPRKKVAVLLEAIANGDEISVVPDSAPLEN